MKKHFGAFAQRWRASIEQKALVSGGPGDLVVIKRQNVQLIIVNVYGEKVVCLAVAAKAYPTQEERTFANGSVMQLKALPIGKCGQVS